MNRVRARLAWLALLAMATPPPLAAQAAHDWLARGVRAYEQLELDSATALLRRVLDRAAADSLRPQDRSRALTYLGAAELFSRKRDAAVAAFRRLVELDPAAKPDALRFPPEVTALFDEVRHTTTAVTIEAPPVTEFRVGVERFAARVRASSAHVVTVGIQGRDGALAQALYDGPIDDSLSVTWDGLWAAGGATLPGDYILRVTSRANAGGAERVAELPLTIERVPPDILPLPALPDAVRTPATRGTARPPVRSLAAGLLAAAAAVVLPSVVTGDADGASGRLVVASAIGVSAMAGFFAGWRQRPVGDSALARARAIEEWRRRAEEVSVANATRRAEVRLIVRAWPAAAREPGTP